MDPISRLAAEPAKAALFLDVDGVLAPIVPRPEDARVPDETRDELRRLHVPLRARRLHLRTRRRRMRARVVGVPELVYVGNHGLELSDEAETWGRKLQDFVADLDWPATEDKGLTASLHYRGMPDEAAARTALEDVKRRAEHEGFVARFGRRVLELLPPLDVDKGTAVRQLLGERGLTAGALCGRRHDGPGRLSRRSTASSSAVRIAVASAEGPAELLQAADLTVSSPAELLALLRRL